MPVTLPGRNTWGGGGGRSAGRSPGGAIHGRRTAPACRRTTTRRGPRARAGVGARHCPAAQLRGGNPAASPEAARRARVERRAGADGSGREQAGSEDDSQRRSIGQVHGTAASIEPDCQTRQLAAGAVVRRQRLQGGEDLKIMLFFLCS